jgi:hypothetical protein
MPYSLGVDLGTTFTSAAIHEGGRSSVVDLSDRASTIPSVVFLADDGSYYVGDAATRRTLMDPARAATDLDDEGRKVFDRFSPDAIPAGATQICAVVADAGHAVDAPEWVDDTVSCVDVI